MEFDRHSVAGTISKTLLFFDAQRGVLTAAFRTSEFRGRIELHALNLLPLGFRIEF